MHPWECLETRFEQLQDIFKIFISTFFLRTASMISYL